MGEDKSLLPFFSSNTLIQFQYERLKPYFKEIYISSKNNKFDFIDDKALILDENKDVFSPILALDSILKKFENKKVFIITVDSPFVSIDTIKELINESNETDICVAKTEKIHNLCGVFSSTIKKTISEMISDDIHKIFYLIRNNNHKIVEFDNDLEFMNINNKNEYEQSIEHINKTYNNKE